MPTKYTIYVHGFWGGFLDKTDANHIGFFESIFKSAFYPSTIEFTSDKNQANILFESVFSPSIANAKKWLYKIQYSGEPRNYPFSDYDMTLFSEKDSNQIVDLPLFVYYIHSNNLLGRLLERPLRTVVPNKFCCFIVSNGSCQVRNRMFNALNQYKKVDSLGNFANNMGSVLQYDYWSPEFTGFISNYKFIICFENSKFGTYSTEKIVNAYLANVIPIYWSSHHIKKVLNPDSMLFLEDETIGFTDFEYEVTKSDFFRRCDKGESNENDESYAGLIQKIVELDNDDAKYLEYVNRPVFTQTDYWDANYSLDALSCKITENIAKVIV